MEVESSLHIFENSSCTKISWKFVQWELNCSIRTDRHDESFSISELRWLRGPSPSSGQFCVWLVNKEISLIKVLFTLQPSVPFRAPAFLIFSPLLRCSNCKHDLELGIADRNFSVGPGYVSRYRDGPGIESRWGRNFPHPSIPSLGPNQPPIQ